MNDKAPLVSIITPCFNGESYLNRYFNAVLNQTYTNLELIFINDGSMDKTEEIALGYRTQLEEKGIKFIYKYQSNHGQAAALNQGLKLFTGDYLVWPDSDDVILPECIEIKVEYLEQNPDIQLVRSNGYYIDEKTEKKSLLTESGEREPEDIFDALFRVKTYGCCACYMMTRKLFLECYPDREIFVSRTGQNWQLLLPAASRSLCGFIDQPLCIIYGRGDSHSRSSRTPKQELEYWNGYVEILKHAIAVSNCDQNYYEKEAGRIKAEQTYYYALTENNKKQLVTAYKDMKQYRKSTLKEKLVFLKRYMETILSKGGKV